MKLRLLVLFCLLPIISKAQEITIQPYLQDAEPNSIRIMWETSEAASSLVEYGSTTAMENEATGFSEEIEDDRYVHEVHLTGLERFTKYYYRVKSGTAQTGPLIFKTPPFPGDDQSFRFVAMSDMQKSNDDPNKFEEIVQEGIMPYLDEHFTGEVADDLGLVLIPGDLVVNGLDYSSWKDDFFDPSNPLFSSVPLYPVPGNHEINTNYFFEYFHLPDNGAEGFEEHCWYKDYSNTRFIGLDSNFPYNTQEQVDWLSEVLESTCDNPDIDFVFAELHHPHKSELWIAGETDFTGLVIEELENFTRDCGKPSIHFFGHTHGYSRGQSRDHKHLWVNVATAGGSIDYWGEFAQFDYDVFTVSEDEWGFVEVEVDAGDDPHFTLKRVSRGDQTVTKDNEVTDVITVRKGSTAIEQPVGIYPINQEIPLACARLKASPFNSVGESGHGAAQWQVSSDCSDWSDPVWDSWKQYENWYFEENTQAEDDLTDEWVTGLQPGQDYCWRVRYRDQELTWSDWSEPKGFATSEATESMNLLENPGAEDGNDGAWEVLEGFLELLPAGECDGTDPKTGEYYFVVGGICEHAPFAQAAQTVDLSEYSDEIDAETFALTYGGHLSNYNGSDLPEVQLRFLDGSGILIGITQVLSSNNSSWTLVQSSGGVPAGTRTVEFLISGTRNSGFDNDSYFDDLFLTIGDASSACDFTPGPLQVQNIAPASITVHPNPASDQAWIRIEGGTNIGHQGLGLRLINNVGQVVLEKSNISSEELILQQGPLPNGIYLVQLYNSRGVQGRAQLVFQ